VDEPSLAGRGALVTGVSRSIGIGWAIARRLHDRGAAVVATGWPDHDAEMPWGHAPIEDPPFTVGEHDLADPAVPARLLDEAMDAIGRVDIVVATHARSSHTGLDEVTADELDRCWATNVRSIVLLAQRLAEIHRSAPADRAPIGRLIWFTSGQNDGAMDGEIAYAVSKGALHQMTRSIDHALAGARVVANCINPGPVDTGYVDSETHRVVASMFPDGRWARPDDIAGIVDFLVSDAGAQIRGQVINSEAGFDRISR
jgi:3-oxoacyl-[acyl-carrier protein] reductase